MKKILFLPLLSFAVCINLFRDLDSRYRTRQQIGNQIFDFVLTLDTDLLMVIDDYCATCPGEDLCYNKELSKSSKTITQNSENCLSTEQIQFTNECAFKYESQVNYTNQGELMMDNILFGSVLLKDFIFGRVLQESDYQGSIGFIGIGPANLDKMYGTSLIETLVNDQGIHAVIGLCVKNNKGFMHIGGFDRAYEKSDLSIYSQKYNDRFSIEISQIQVANTKVSSKIEARLNVGVDYLLLPYPVIKKIIKQLANFYKDNCQQALCEEEGHVFFGSTLIRPPTEYPEILINLQGFEIKLNGFLKKCGPEHYCSIIRNGGELAVIGAPVLENLYLVIDMENSKIAIGKLNECRETDELSVIYEVEQNFFALSFKLFMVFSSLIMIVVIGWRCGKSYELEFEIISGDDD